MSPASWAHTLTYERQQREAAAAIATAREEFTGRGVSVLDERGDYESRVDSLLHDGEPITDHSGCPGHSVHIGFRHGDGIHTTGYCADPTGNGHTYRYGSTGGGSGRDRANETPEQAEARKTERRELIRLNRVAPVDCTNMSASAVRWAIQRSRYEWRCGSGLVTRTKGCRSAQRSDDR